MIIKEQEAYTKACPFAASFDASRGRQLWRVDSSTEHNSPHASMCIGSKCMAWEYTDNEWVNPALFECQKYGWPELKEIKPPAKPYHQVDLPTYEVEKKAFEEKYPDFDWYKVNDQQAVDQGWEMAPSCKFGEPSTRTMHRYRRKRPEREGQCGRTHFVEITQG